MNIRYQSWARNPRHDPSRAEAVKLRWRSHLPSFDGKDMMTCLPFGNGRSYGDSCLNDGGVLVDARGLDRFIAFDRKRGVLHCESGVLLSEILDLIVPSGWFLPVVPGTKQVTVGGAIANDIHGKNHVIAGTFGCHLLGFELLRSQGPPFWCSPTENPEWFRATIGGLGLTGVILTAQIALKPVHNSAVAVETVRFSGFDEFFALSEESAGHFEYDVGWVDGTVQGRQQDRGLFIRGNHAAADTDAPKAPGHPLQIPFTPPFSLLHRPTTRAYNAFHYNRQSASCRFDVMHFDSFFFPLDGVDFWNRLYGPRGFFQHQCVLPHTAGTPAIREIMDTAAGFGINPYLTVIKVFGSRPSPGLMSFPLPGVTLALDFPNFGRKTLTLLDVLDKIVFCAGGRVNPYKDSRMSPESFKRYFPQWEELEQFRDPIFSSSFWRRVTRN